jgi:cytochrome c peroxidase
MENGIRFSLFFFSLLMFVASCILVSCDRNGDETAYKPTPFKFPSLPDFPSKLNIPEANPMTVEGVELGRYLFYDGRLSGRTHPDSLMSCASCHLQSKAFEIGTDHPRFKDGHPRGLPMLEYPEGKPTPHMMLPVVNLVYNNKGYMWNGFLENSNNATGIPGYDFTGVSDLNFKNLEAFTYMAIVAEHEMNGTISRTVAAIESDPRYREMFRKAFGTEDISADRISMAISQFVRSIISYRSRYHKWLRNEAELTDSELRGHELFFSEDADCFHCHGGTALLTSFEYFNNAKDTEFTDSRDRNSITKQPWDIGAYRAPSLINIELTGPYMHDGRFRTLDEVIDFYSEGLVYSPYVHPLMKFVHDGGVHLSDDEKADLKAFLLTLTDHELLTDPAYAAPETIREWLAR